MCAAYLYVICQALDLRVMYITFLGELQKRIGPLTRPLVSDADLALHHELDRGVFEAVSHSWNSTTSLNLNDRCAKLGAASLPYVINYLYKHGITLSSGILTEFKLRIAELAKSSFIKTREEFFAKQTTPSFLGYATKSLYLFVRHKLKVPFYKGLVDHPTIQSSSCHSTGVKKTIDSWVSLIYAAIVDDRIWTVMSNFFP